MKRLSIRDFKVNKAIGSFKAVKAIRAVIKAIGLMIPFLAFTDVKIALGAGWSGVDESVVEHYAEKAGRSAWTPFINTDQGDLLLFVFLIAGVIGGFVIGYYWRTLFKTESKNPKIRNSEILSQKPINTFRKGR